jgi:hypothetical protein
MMSQDGSRAHFSPKDRYFLYLSFWIISARVLKLPLKLKHIHLCVCVCARSELKKRVQYWPAAQPGPGNTVAQGQTVTWYAASVVQLQLRMWG